MDSTSARFFYPLHNCKIIHLVRHAQAMHNLEAEFGPEALLSPHLFDAQLSPFGLQQVNDLRSQVRSNGLLKRVELVVVSPLFRAMQTAVGVFGDEDNENEVNSPPILALELARDRMGLRPSDMRRNVSEYETLFPTIDFSLMETEHDNLWRPDLREPEGDLAIRAVEFMKWLWTREEKEIVVVSHGIVLQHMLYGLGNDSDPTVKNEVCKRFGNCEVRTVVIVDKGVVVGI